MANTPLTPQANTPLCGDPDCVCPACRQETIDEWRAREEYTAKKLVRPWAVTAEEEERFGWSWQI